MVHSLVFTVCSLLLMILLVVAILMKSKTKSVRTKLFIALAVYAAISGIFELKGIITLLFITPAKSELAMAWEMKNICLFHYIYIFVIYSIVTLKGTSHKKLIQYIFKTKPVLISFICLFAFCTWYMLAENFKYFGPDEIIYMGAGTSGMLIVLTLIALSLALYNAFKQRHEKPNVLKCFILIAIISFIVVPLQAVFVQVSLIHFLTIIILYIVYYNIENPDLELLEEVTKLKSDIDKSSNAKLDFLFNLSYDLISPMNVIVSLSDSLSNIENFDEQTVKAQIRSVKYAGHTLLDSIDNLLDISENVEQDDKLNIKEYSVYELFKRMESVVKTRIGAKQISFEMNIDDNISSKLKGDINKIQKILLNVLNNAIKYTDVGRIKLIVTSTNEKDIQVLHVKISDTGNGISDDMKPYIFSDSKETSGVGLALTKKYVEAMNGTITFDSVFGAGTTFNISIPQEIVGTSLVSEDKLNDKKDEAIELIDCSQYKALIVDDDILDIKVTTRLLEKYKFQITTITNSNECIDRIKKEEEFDILFLDHKMPIIDGVELMKILKGLDGYKIPKIVALTANAVAGARSYYLNEGFDEYLSKPIDKYELDKIINRTFKK